MIVSHSTSRQAPPPHQGAAPYSSYSPPPAPDALAELRMEVAHGLQLSRASTLALMRLQLAIQGGERAQALEAVDRLDTLDAELEGVVLRLSPPGDNDEVLQAIARHLESQKLALAFEKLALASGIVGPDLVSIEHAWPARDQAAPPPAETGDPDQVREMPDLSELWTVMDQFEPEQPRGISPKVWGLIATLLVAMAIAGAVLLLR